MMDKRLQLSIYSVGGTILDELVEYVSVPLTDGTYGILYGHAPLLGAVSDGILRYRKGAEEHEIHVSDGVVQVADNRITVLLRGQ